MPFRNVPTPVAIGIRNLTLTQPLTCYVSSAPRPLFPTTIPSPPRPAPHLPYDRPPRPHHHADLAVRQQHSHQEATPGHVGRQPGGETDGRGRLGVCRNLPECSE